MNFHTRKWVKPEDLNPNGTLFGGSLLCWIDEEAAIYAMCQLGNEKIVTKFMSEINFVSSARLGDVIELGMTATHFGRSSITMRCEVRNKITHKSILTVEKLVFVNLDANGEPAPHGKTEITPAQNGSPDIVAEPVGERLLARVSERAELAPAARLAGAVPARAAAMA